MRTTIKLKIHWLIAFCIALLVYSCEKDKDKDPENDTTIPESILGINSFIQENMTYGYFWNTSMPVIDYSKEPDSKAYFEKLLKKPDDRWSFITDDIDGLIAYFEGVQKSTGYSIQPYYLREGMNQVIIMVEYVYRNTPASKADLKRGDIIYRINGQIITDSNLESLLKNDDLTLTLGYFDDSGTLKEISPTIDISAVEGLAHHPIIASSITRIDGHRIGYIAYSSFLDNYDTAVVSTFAHFKAEQVTDLVLDLRYNSGGALSSAQLIASMIAPVSAEGEPFIRQAWNENLVELNDESKLISTPENLDLGRVFILTTGKTASASETVIYGLSPYMDVIQLGTQTYGKYYGSVMIPDISPRTQRRLSSWAIQPIVMRLENVNNDIDYLKGIPPTYELFDNYYNAPLGHSEEHFLANVISVIVSGNILPVKKVAPYSLPQEGIDRLWRGDPLHGVMLVEFPSKGAEQ